MATRKKKVAAAEEAVGLKQKSLLFFFSNPSACPPPQRAASQQQQALLAEDDSHSSTRDSSCSSYQQENGETLRWSQLLTGWSTAQGLPSPHGHNVDVDDKKCASEDHNEDQRKTPFALSAFVYDKNDRNDDEEQDEGKAQFSLSTFVDAKHAVDDVHEKIEKESQFCLRLCKKRRTPAPRHSCSPSLNASEKFDTETGSYDVRKHPCSCHRNDSKNLHTEAGVCEVCLKGSEISEAYQLNLAVSPSKELDHEVCRPGSPSRSCKRVCTESTFDVSLAEHFKSAVVQSPDPSSMLCDSESLHQHSPSKNNSKAIFTETKSDEASPAVLPSTTTDVEYSHPHGEPGLLALNPESDLRKVEPSTNVCRLDPHEVEPSTDVCRLDPHEVEPSTDVCILMMATPLHPVEGNIHRDSGELEKASSDESESSHGCDKFAVVEAHENRDKSGHRELLKGKGYSGHADLGMSNVENADLGMSNVENASHVTKAHRIIMDIDSKTDFLKLKRGSGHRVSAPEEVSEAPITEYEREREENILRNQHFLQKLGISSSALKINKESSYSSSIKPRGKAISKVKPPLLLPLRRSRRLLQDAADVQFKRVKETAEATNHAGTIEEEVLFYDDSSVLRYTCEGGVSNSGPYPCHGYAAGVNSIVGFQPLDGVLQDTYLTRIYTMSASLVSHSQRTLLAAGGHQGQIAVFGTSFLDRDGKPRETFTSMAIDSDVSQGSGSLLSWKGSSGWISGVKFLSTQTQENANLLLSSANDGNLVLWDINKQQKAQHSSMRLAGLPPLKVTEARGIHSNGIFSMHELSGHVLTASKDSTVGYSKITNQEIITERSISGHHSGAIRGVNCRDASIIADCGGDGLICILDLRMAEPCTLTIDTADPTGVNVVEWCSSQEHLLLSASKDPQITLHDVRNVKEPLHRLSGHVNPKVQRCSQIYRPTFVAQGLAIASPGQGSKALSLYSVQTGKAISRGHLGYDATMVMWTASGNDSTSVLWVASRNIAQLLPLWQT